MVLRNKTKAQSMLLKSLILKAYCSSSLILQRFEKHTGTAFLLLKIL
jgi:hypothetical protein